MSVVSAVPPIPLGNLDGNPQSAAGTPNPKLSPTEKQKALEAAKRYWEKDSLLKSGVEGAQTRLQEVSSRVALLLCGRVTGDGRTFSVGNSGHRFACCQTIGGRRPSGSNGFATQDKSVRRAVHILELIHCTLDSVSTRKNVSQLRDQTWLDQCPVPVAAVYERLT